MSVTRGMMEVDSQLFCASTQSLLITLFGKANWVRWNNLRQGQVDFQTFMAWLLDLAEAQQQQEDLQQSDEYHSTGYEIASVDDGIETSNKYSDQFAPRGIGKCGKNKNASSDDEVQIIPEASQPGVKYENDSTFEMSYSVTEGSAGNYDGPDNFPTSQYGSAAEVGCEDAGASSGAAAGVKIVYEHSSKQFRCELCQVSLSGLEIVQQHISIRHAGEPMAISCTCCSIHFLEANDYVAHHAQKTFATNPNVCTYCAKSFSSAASLAQHITNIHEKVNPRYQCDFCGKKFRYSTHKSSHQKKCHRGGGTAVQ